MPHIPLASHSHRIAHNQGVPTSQRHHVGFMFCETSLELPIRFVQALRLGRPFEGSAARGVGSAWHVLTDGHKYLQLID